jgi:hypothetical protein
VLCSAGACARMPVCRLHARRLAPAYPGPLPRTVLAGARTHRHGAPRPEEDIFSAVGGLELGADAELDSLGADLASSSGHEPHSEASRIIFVRGINVNATDEDIATMFKVGSSPSAGEIRLLEQRRFA